jgi:cytochrome c
MYSRLFLSLLAVFTAMAVQAADPEKGKRQYTPCATCHAISVKDSSALNLGPSLAGVYGKRAATNRPEFAYSDALKKSGITWNDETLEAWIKNARELVPGTKMSAPGIENEEVRANIIAYIKQASK